MRFAKAALFLLACSVVWADGSEFRDLVSSIKRLDSDVCARELAEKAGLVITSVAWEDTARTHGSNLGPNISDVRLQVRLKNDEGKVEAVETMPLIRVDNYRDQTVDLAPSRFHLLVGNESGEALRKVTLSEYLSDLPSYLSDGGKLADKAEKERSLMVPRDSHVLVSAQASLLPIPSGSKAKVDFNPVIFNYQSSEENPAVLVIIATSQGTSATIIDNTRDAFKDSVKFPGIPGQQLFHNLNGQRAPFRGERLSSYVAADGDPGAPTVGANAAAGLGVVALIQVPLVHKPVKFPSQIMWGASALEFSRGGRPEADLEDAVVTFGEAEGPFVELAGLDIKRDARFPIRVTTMFYKAIDNPNVTSEHMSAVKTEIERVYQNPAAAGSLVVDGPQGRPTEHGVHGVEDPQ